MSGYRFCRTDDVPLLVAAYNACYRPHFADVPPLTIEGFRRTARELSLWTSSCMVAEDGGEPIGVLLAAKRETANFVWAVGVRPDAERRGHGRHMLASLAQKLAILGPPLLLAEVPAEWKHARAFLEACGWRADRTYTDFLLHRVPARPEGADFLATIGLDELAAAGAFDTAASRCWARAPETLRNRRDRVRALVLAGGERVEAALLYDDAPAGAAREILGFHVADPDRNGPLVELLVRAYGAAGDGPVVLRRAHRDEMPYERLEALGFRPAGRTIGYALEARET